MIARRYWEIDRSLSLNVYHRCLGGFTSGYLQLSNTSSYTEWKETVLQSVANVWPLFCSSCDNVLRTIPIQLRKETAPRSPSLSRRRGLKRTCILLTLMEWWVITAPGGGTYYTCLFTLRGSQSCSSTVTSYSSSCETRIHQVMNNEIEKVKNCKT